MDQHKKQNNPIFSQINSSNKALQLLLSLSALAIIASQYSSLLSHLPSINFLSYSTTDRHYIFLLCNGLMLLVIKTSGLFASPAPPGPEFYRDSHVIRHHVRPQSDDLPEANAETNIKVVTQVEEEQGDAGAAACVISDLVDEQQGQGEEEEEQGILLWSTEELNRKCDEFISRMKYRIKNEVSWFSTSEIHLPS